MVEKYDKVISYTESLIDDEWIENEIKKQEEFIKQLEELLT